MIFKAKETVKGVAQIKEFAEQEKLQFKTAQILMQRGIDTHEKFIEFTNPTLNQLRDPFLLLNMDKCHKRIQEAIEKNESILLFGDYDVDGISAVSILYKFLKNKITNLNYFLPNRYEDGYGLTIESSKKVIDKFHPNLIITVDCGISCADEVEYIKSLGIDIIITDHHEIPDVVPNAIVVDPKLPNQDYGFNELCGAGVAMKVVEAFIGRENLDEYLAICAIATVSDIVPLVDENRAIVKLGLKKQNLLPLGIKMLLNDLKIKDITSQAISFKIAPKLNASGRMGNAYHSLFLYISDDVKLLKDSLKNVDELNTKRQKLSQEIYDDCLKIIRQNRLYTKKAIILKSSKWDSGLLGIACARLVDDFYKPVFLFSDDNGILKGSVRSTDLINIHKVLSTCNNYLETFGGHSMAAGLSLKVDYFDEFKEQIFEYLDLNTTEKLYRPIKTYDVSIKPEEVTIEFAKELEILEPVGCENPNPIFLVNYKDAYASKMPNFDNHINVTIEKTLKFVAFNSVEYIDDYLYSDYKQTLFELQLNRFNGREFLKGIIKRTLFSGYGKNLQEIAYGRILKQYKTGKKFERYIDYFADNQVKVLLDKLLNKQNGTAIVIYNNSTYLKYKNLLSKYDLNYYVGGSQSKFEENCVVFALDDIQDIASYHNVIFLDTLQKTDFLSDFNGEIYAIKNGITELTKFDFSRDTFGKVYNAIKSTIKQLNNYRNELELYWLVKRNNPHVQKFTYAKFIACLYTFLELNIIKKDNETNKFYIDDSIKTSLENSSFYNSLKFISIIK
ncbi:MAG TPA: single-stranded-DNA-specific exonuclease RecJ [Clostridiales bacterium]|nr:single-stranded-DNA-specific exonuclease RecJ [Clostridiales bacterium]